MIKTKFLHAFTIVLILLQAIMPIPALAMATAASTDQPDYVPGSVVTLSGDNSNGAGYLPAETVQLDVSGPSGFAASCEAVANENASWFCQVTLPSDAADGTYDYTASGLTSGASESGSFTVTAPPPPVVEPTQEPTAEPTTEPTQEPTAEPTSEPTQEPTVAPSEPPFIYSDKEDYAPAELVTLTSGNWLPAENVHIFVNDDIGSTWNFNTDVTADDNGQFTYQFYLPSWFVATYSIVATGEFSGVATTTFTDARVVTDATLNGGASVTVAAGASITAVVTVDTNGTGANARWRSTGWRISTTGPVAYPGDVTCFNHANFDSAGTNTVNISINAPGVPGTYNAYFVAFNDDTCSSASGANAPSVTKILENGVTVTAATSLSLATPSPASITYGSTGPVSLSATLKRSDTNANLSGATIDFLVDGSSVGTTVTNVSGVATLSYDPSTLNAGSHNVHASFAGQTLGSITYTGSTSGTQTLSVNQRAVTVTADNKSKVYGDTDPALTYQITSGSLASGDAFSGALVRETGEDVGIYAINQGSLALSGNYALTYVSADLTIAPRDVQVTAEGKSKTYGDADPALTYIISDGSLAFSDSFSGALVRETGEDVGEYDINQGTLALNGNYNLAFVPGTFTIGTRAVTVTAEDQSKVYGDADPALTYQITSGSLAFGDAFSGSLVRETGEDVGEYDINQGTLALDGNYVLSYVGADLTITPRPITVTADPQTKVYGESDPALTYSVTSGSLVSGDALSGALTRAAGEDVGSYAITQGSLTAGGNYTLSFVGADLEITLRPIEITAAAKTKVYGQADPALTYQITDGSLAFSDAFSGSLGRTAGEDVGSYAINQGSLALNGNYNLTFVGASLSITQATLTVTADNQSKTYGQADPAFSFDVDGFQFDDDLSDIDSAPVCSVSGAHEDAGSYTIECSGGADNNYDFEYEVGTLTVGQALLSVTADNQTITYGDPDPAFTFQYNGFQLGDDAGDLETAPSCNVAGAHVNAGTYTISCFGGSDANYSFAYVDGTLTVNPASLTITANNKSKTYGSANPLLTASYSGFVNGDDEGDLDTPVSLTTSADETSPVGSYVITANNAADVNYTITFVDGALSIEAKSLTITANNQSKTYGDEFSFDGSEFTTDGLVNGDTVTSVTLTSAGAPAAAGVGSYAIVASNAVGSGLTNYEITYEDGSLAVGTRPITVTADPQTKVYGDADPALTYQITSGDLVNGDAFSGALARAAGEDVGIYAISQSSLALSGNYNLAFVGADLTITKRPVTVTVDAKTKVYGDVDPALTYQITSGSLAFSDDFSGSLIRAAGQDVGTYAITQGTLALSDNYDLTYVDADLTITVRPVTVTADAQSRTYGDADPALTYQITSGSLAFSDVFSGALEREAGEDVGTYDILQGDLVLSSNYDLTYVGADFEVTHRPVTVTADAKSKVYGDVDPALTYQITSGTLAFSDAFAGALTRVGGENVGSYDIQQGSLALSSNYILMYMGANLTITARSIEVTAENKSKTYGDADPALTYQITSGSLAFSDAFSGALARDPGETVGNYAITQGSLALNTNYNLTFLNGTLTIGKKAASVTPNADGKTYGDADPALTGTLSGFLPTDGVTAVYSRGAGENVGNYIISAVLSPDGVLSNYDITYNTAAFQITARPITITADAKTKVYGEVDPTLTYQITFGSLAFSDAFSGALTRDSGENVSTYAITQGSLALSSNYDFTYVGADFEITVRPVTVTADAKSKVYGNVDPGLTYQITSGSLAFSDAFSGALTRVTGEDVGTYPIQQGTLMLSSNYALTFVGADLTITVRPVTVTADAQSKSYGDADPALTYHVTSGSLAFSDAFSGELSRVSGENVGNYAISQGTLALSDNYDLAYIGVNLTITARPITITADAKTKVYGDADPALTYQITSGSLAFSDAFTGSLTRDAGEDVGSYAITQGTVALDGNYALTFVGANLTIGTRAVEITADAKTKVYGEDDLALTYQITDGSLAFSDAFSGSLTREAGEDVDSYAITQGTVALDGNYALTFVGADLTITERSIEVTADPQTKVYGDADPALTYQITDGSLAFSDAFTGALGRAPGQDVGSYAINQGTLALSSNYVLSFVGADFEITIRPVTVTADAQTKIYGNADPALTYQVTSGLLAYSDAFTGALERDTGEDVGTYGILQGDLALSSNYQLTYIGADFEITERPVTVTSDAKSKTYGDLDPALTYQITSGLLAFSDAFTGILTRAAGENAGTYAIQQGTLALSSNYDLTYVGANLTINKAVLTITAEDKSKYFAGSDPAFTFQYSGFVNSETASVIDTPPTCGVTGDHAAVGSYPIVCSNGMDNNYNFTYVNGTLNVAAWTLRGFYSPVDMSGSLTVYNLVKGGSTVPLKFEIFSGSTELTNVADVKSLVYGLNSCNSSAVTDEIETVATGGTILRYDSTSGQFIYNWKTPSGTAGKCFRVTLTTQDNSTLVAYFKMK